MSQKSDNATPSSERLVKDIRGRRAGNIRPSVNGGDKMCQMAAQKCTGLVERKGP